MDLRLTEDQRMIVEAVGGLAARLRESTSRWDAEDTIEPEAFEALSELGLPGLFVDEEAGGAGFGVATGLMAIETLAHGSGALALRLAAHAASATPALAAAGLDRQSCAAFAEGRRWCTRVDRIEQRDGRLFGAARWVVGCADTAEIAVLTFDGALHLVDAKTDGLVIEAAQGLGMRGAGLAHVRFEGVAAGSPVGQLESSTVARLADLERAAIAAVGVGIGRAAVDEAKTYALDRKQFGRPIADFQAIQWMIADAATEVDAAALLAARAGIALDAGEDADEASRTALVLTAEAALNAAQRAIQIHGGYGFVREFPVERLARDARYLGMALGGRDAHRARLGRDLLA